MGVSTNAYLYYGFDIHDAESGEDDFVLPDSFFENLNLSTGEVVEALEMLCEEDDFVDFNSHCSGDYPIYFLCTAIYSASRGYPKIITELKIKPEWDDRLKTFCEKHGIPFKQPSWRLASYTD